MHRCVRKHVVAYVPALVCVYVCACLSSCVCVRACMRLCVQNFIGNHMAKKQPTCGTTSWDRGDDSGHLLFFIIVSLIGSWALSMGVTTNFAQHCGVLNRAVKTRKIHVLQMTVASLI